MGGSNKQTTTSTNAPYKAAQPLLDKSMGDALAQYNNGGLVRPNTMSTVVPYAQQTTAGMGSLQNLANANNNGAGASGQYQSIIDNGGYNANQMDALNGIRQTANSSFDPYNNPAFAKTLDIAQQGAMLGNNQNASALGRYGSGTAQGVMEKSLGDLTANMVGNEYQNWQGRKDAAQQNLFNAGQTGQENIGNAYSAAQAPANTLMQVGGMNEDLYGRTLNDTLRIANERQNAPLANMSALNAIASGSGNLGSTTQTAQGPSNTFSNIAGAALGGSSLASGGKA